MLKLPIAVVQQLISGWLFDVDIQGWFHGVYSSNQDTKNTEESTDWTNWTGKRVDDVWPPEASAVFYQALNQATKDAHHPPKPHRTVLFLNRQPQFFAISAIRLPHRNHHEHHLPHFLIWAQPEHLITDELLQMAFFDALTGLANRRLLHDHITQAIHAACRTGQWGAILFLDLDGFKQINDQWGHAAGDDILKQVAQRLTRAVRKTDTVARLGGDEFVVLLHHLDTTQNTAINSLQLVADHLLQQFTNEAFVCHDTPIHLSVSIGAVLFNQDNATHLNVDELIHQADQAMYQAKAAGRNTSRLFSTPLPAQYFIQNQTNSPQCDGGISHIKRREMTAMKHSIQPRPMEI
jgi:diguanylate cyclase (GGDEF)-like protein